MTNKQDRGGLSQIYPKLTKDWIFFTCVLLIGAFAVGAMLDEENWSNALTGLLGTVGLLLTLDIPKKKKVEPDE